MASETTTAVERPTEQFAWKGGALAGLLGAVAAGAAGALGYGDSVGRSAGLGIGYGVVLWVVLAALVMPIWLGAVGSPADPPLPNFDPMSLVGHVAYGLVLGVAFPLVRNL